jgi:hypothetical protein
MDTSSEYIQMCEKAREIKEIMPKEFEGDFLVINGSILVTGISRLFNPGTISVIWLPRQDQLQEMVDIPIGDDEDEGAGLHHFFAFCDSKVPVGTISPKSWEQLWLAFVMKEKYGKTWNGTEWTKEE